MSVKWLTHVVSHIDVIADPTSVASSAATAGAAATAIVASLRLAVTETPGSSTIPPMLSMLLTGEVNAINQRTVHAKPRANATSTPTGRRTQEATVAGTDMATTANGTGEPVKGPPTS